MKCLLFALAAIVLILQASCNNTDQDRSISINKEGIPVISLEKISEKGELNFSDLAEDFEIIKLETNQDCLIDRAMRSYVSEDYIIISTINNGLLLFSRSGSFIRAISKKGKGPGEIDDPNCNIEFDETSKSLFIFNRFSKTKTLYCFNIESGTYANITLQHDVRPRDIILINDSTLIVSTMATQGFPSDCPVYAQTLSGRLLWKIKHTNSNGATNGGISLVDEQVYFKYLWGDDTLFTIKNGKLFPHSIYNSSSKIYLSGKQESIGDIYLGISVLNNETISGSFSAIIGYKESNMPGIIMPEFEERTHFIYNTDKGKVTIIDKIRDDILGSEKNLRAPQTNGFTVIKFQATEIFELAEKLESDPETPEEIKLRVLGIRDQININDNPILLIGKMKKAKIF